MQGVRLNIVVDCYHPANFLILKNPMRQLATEGHDVFWCIRKKDVLEDLVRGENLPYSLLTTPRPGILGRAIELVEHDYKVFREIVRRKARLAIGASISVAHAARLVPGTDSIVFNDDDAEVVKPFVKLGYPFADWIVTPECLQEDHGPHHVTHNSYHVLSYLHPNHFKAADNILNELGVDPNQRLFLLRFVSLSAFHDTHAVGLSFDNKIRLISYLKQHGRVLISCEGEYPREFASMIFKADPVKMHSVLAHCDLVVGDSQTMTAEAAVLGIPSVRCNTFVSKISYLDDLEKTYGLTFGYQPERFDEAFKKIESLVQSENLKGIWQGKRMKMLKDKEDLAEWIYRFIKEKYLPQ
jgi:predicted glycosyltransferase